MNLLSNNTTARLTAIIADDEDNLRDYLATLLTEIWPELTIVAQANNGKDAIAQIEQLQPDIAFLDINMPGLTGLQVASYSKVNCKIVFITAYNEYAINAFELGAVDYLLKPIDKIRLLKTIKRLQTQFEMGDLQNASLSTLLQQFSQTIAKTEHYIRWLKALDHGKVYIIPVEDVRYLKAGDKYTTVVTHEKNWLIRKPIKELENELDPTLFWRIHRSVIVNAACIINAERTIDGRYELQVLDCEHVLIVSRAYGFRFKQM